MIIVRSSEVENFHTPPPNERDLKVLISPRLQQNVEGLSIGMTILPPGQTSTYHAHPTEIEAWVVLDGQGEVIVDGERASVGPETVVINLPHQKHQLVNSGEMPMRLLWIYTPPGAESSILDGTFR